MEYLDSKERFSYEKLFLEKYQKEPLLIKLKDITLPTGYEWTFSEKDEVSVLFRILEEDAENYKRSIQVIFNGTLKVAPFDGTKLIKKVPVSEIKPSLQWVNLIQMIVYSKSKDKD